MSRIQAPRLQRCAVAVALTILSGTALADTTLVRAGRVIDVDAGKVLNDQLIRIEDGRITSITSAAGAGSAANGGTPWTGRVTRSCRASSICIRISSAVLTQGTSPFAPEFSEAEIRAAAEEAANTGTLDAARSMNKESDFPSITVGKRADMIAVEGDPLANIDLLRTIAHVMKDGKVIK